MRFTCSRTASLQSGPKRGNIGVRGRESAWASRRQAYRTRFVSQRDRLGTKLAERGGGAVHRRDRDLSRDRWLEAQRHPLDSKSRSFSFIAFLRITFRRVSHRSTEKVPSGFMRREKLVGVNS